MKLKFKYFPYESNQNVLESNISNIVILHGLFGSSKNWITIAKDLSQKSNVYVLDQRNHGDSSHSDTHRLVDMVDDLEEFLQTHNLANPILLGHSMGGLVVMMYALTKRSIIPDRIIIQDIAPRDYPFVYDQEVEAMSLDVSKAKSRSEIDDLMKELVPNTFIRQFLQMNLERAENGGYYWKLNIKAISHSRKMFESEFEAIKGQNSNVSALFILGGDSEYIRENDRSRILEFFPKAQIVSIPGAGHYIQYTHNVEFMKILYSFLSTNQK